MPVLIEPSNPTWGLHLQTIFHTKVKVNGAWINIGSNITWKRRSKLSPNTLAQNWGCTFDTAQRTLVVMTQHGIHTVAKSSLSRLSRTNDRQLQYKRLGVNIFTDTLDSAVRSKQGKKYRLVFCTHFEWPRAYSMPTKGTAHETLYNLLKHDGWPNVVICDGSKDQNLGDFKKKSNEADIHIKHFKPYSPW